MSLNEKSSKQLSLQKKQKGNLRDIFRSVKEEGESARVEPVYLNDLDSDEARREFQERICEITGAIDHEVGFNLLTKACDALTKSSDSIETSVRTLNAITKAMYSMQPLDEIEGQLISQLVVLHEHCMSWLGRARRTDRVDFANTYLNGASKLMTRHQEALAALIKYRRGGQQRVYVEHVHVHGGGQAIVGNVGTEGGLNRKNEEGPHAKV